MMSFLGVVQVGLIGLFVSEKTLYQHFHEFLILKL